jgi:hypothetical protein
MYRLSYNPNNPTYTIFDTDFALEIFTYENVYGIDPKRTELTVEGDRAILTARGLTWAGGSEPCEGGAMLLVERTEGGLRFKVEAAHQKKLRSVKVIIPGLSGSSVTSDNSQEMPILADGMLYDYPHWNLFQLKMPIVFLKSDDTYTYFAAKDAEVTPKRFAFIPREGGVDVELVYEALATESAAVINSTPWEMGTTKNPRAEAELFLDWIAETYGFGPFDSRPDVPAWMRDISLVLSIHGMHFSGYVFNTYKDMLNVIRWFAERIEGKRILAFLPGWEGRYYWQYGDYRAEPRLGGAEGFTRLIDGAHELGVRVMPMFGANCTNREHPDFPEYGPISLLHDASGTQFLGNRPDWSNDRSSDPGWQIWLNPAAPAWQEKLTESLIDLVSTYGFDAVFLDTHYTWTNDPYYAVYEGYKTIKAELKSKHPDLLLAGENWYDALLGITPLFQLYGEPNWDDIFEKYARSTAHLSTPSPCRGSTGVHEDGYGDFKLPALRRSEIPMVTIVDGTLTSAPDTLMEYVKRAEEYTKNFITT